MKVYKFEHADKWVQDVAHNMRDAAEKGLLSAAVRTVSHIQTELIPSTRPIPVDRGTYRAAWRAEKHEKGAIVYNSAPHAAVIEYGVEGSRVVIGPKMIQALAEWVRRKGIGGRYVTSTRNVSVNFGTGRAKVAQTTSKFVKPTATDALQIAWAIAKSMKENGIFNHGKGLGIFQKACVKIPNLIREEVVREIRKAFK